MCSKEILSRLHVPYSSDQESVRFAETVIVRTHREVRTAERYPDGAYHLDAGLILASEVANILSGGEPSERDEAEDPDLCPAARAVVDWYRVPARKEREWEERCSSGDASRRKSLTPVTADEVVDGEEGIS